MLLVQGTLLVAAFGCNVSIVGELNEFKKLTPLVESLVKIPVHVCLATASKFMRFCLVQSGLKAKDTYAALRGWAGRGNVIHVSLNYSHCCCNGN